VSSGVVGLAGVGWLPSVVDPDRRNARTIARVEWHQAQRANAYTTLPLNVNKGERMGSQPPSNDPTRAPRRHCSQLWQVGMVSVRVDPMGATSTVGRSQMQTLKTDDVRELARALNAGGQKFPPGEVIALVHTFGFSADSDLFGWRASDGWHVVGVRDGLLVTVDYAESEVGVPVVCARGVPISDVAAVEAYSVDEQDTFSVYRFDIWSWRITLRDGQKIQAPVTNRFEAEPVNRIAATLLSALANRRS